MFTTRLSKSGAGTGSASPNITFKTRYDPWEDAMVITELHSIDWQPVYEADTLIESLNQWDALDRAMEEAGFELDSDADDYDEQLDTLRDQFDTFLAKSDIGRELDFAQAKLEEAVKDYTARHVGEETNWLKDGLTDLDYWYHEALDSMGEAFISEGLRFLKSLEDPQTARLCAETGDAPSHPELEDLSGGEDGQSSAVGQSQTDSENSDDQSLLSVDLDLNVGHLFVMHATDTYQLFALVNTGASLSDLDQQLRDPYRQGDETQTQRVLDDKVRQLIAAGTPPRLTDEDTEIYFRYELTNMSEIGFHDRIRPKRRVGDLPIIIRYPRERSMSDDEWETSINDKLVSIIWAVLNDVEAAVEERRDELWELFTADNICFAAEALHAWKRKFAEERFHHHAEQEGCAVFPASDDALEELILADVDHVLRDTWVDADGNPLTTLLVATLGEDHLFGAEWNRRQEEYARADETGKLLYYLPLRVI